MKKKLIITRDILNTKTDIFDYGKFRQLDEESKVATESEVSQHGKQRSSPRFPILERLLGRLGISQKKNTEDNAENSETEALETPKNEEPKEEYPSVPYFHLYKYATNLDKLFILIGIVFCVVAAICNSLFSIVFGDITGVIIEYVATVTNGTDEIERAEEHLQDGLMKFVIYCCVLGVLITIACYVSTLVFNYGALKQTYRIRDMFLAKVLDQDISWYDLHKTGDFASRVADDLKKVEEGIGEKVSIFIFNEIVFITSTIQGLVEGWELALICMISFPVTMGTMGLVAWISSKFSKAEMDAYGEAGAIAEETLTSIRTVVAFGGQIKEQERYDTFLLSAKNNNIKRSFFNGFNIGLMWFFTYASYSMAFWYGVKLILKEKDLPPDEKVYDPATMVTVFFSILTATWYFGMAAPYIETFGIAKGAATKIFGIIESKSIINASKGKGVKPSKVNGNITFKDVNFNYPSRSEVEVLKSFNLTVKSGERVALVGSSGCGKSTCVQLIQRYYDPSAGNIYIDDTKLTELDLTWLRNHIGVVGQEPVLFETTITENIKLGCTTATRADIERAAKKANAHTFISLLPQGYDTFVGERGAQLSGGQKQRIAIARALVREPTILLLDEATSALDTRSEAVVQAALDAASHECTTIIVAHRLSTVKNADRIVVISEGQVQEQGTHDELMAAKGAYHQLISAQVKSDIEERGDLAQESETEAKNSLIRQPSEDVTDRSDMVNFVSEEDMQNEDIKLKSSSLWAIIKFNKPEWWIITIGCIVSAINGAAMPLYAIVFGNILGVLASNDSEYVQREANKYSLYFLIIGIVSGIVTVLQTHTLGVAGENLTMRLRSRMFKAFLSQEMGWYDNKQHTVGSLCARLSGETASVQGATGQRIGTILTSMSTILITLVTCFYYEWRISLISLCFTPGIVMCIFLEQKYITQESTGHYDALEKSTKIAVEAINGIRTVASLGCENIFHDLYMKELIPYKKAAKRNSHVRGLVYGFSRSLMFFNYAVAIYYGVQLIKNEGLDYSRVFKVSQSLMACAWSLGAAMAFTPNFQKGLIAANRIFELLSRIPKIQDGSSNVHEKWDKGNINYKSVYFSYPSRSTVTVLKDLSLSVIQGKTVALVGPSGCGKSTIIQLLERFYDPKDGKVMVDEKGIDLMNLLALRSQLGIVSQEPNLFSKTIAENIGYGDNTRVVSKEEIIDAARSANIHSFIASLPMGYDTPLGEKGTQLSGGQKQRIAIARALIRNPKVLLLDEATSALDTESEKVVQEALDNAKKGRTCISIAHRLTTIQDADVICVINRGKVAEMGTHSELLNLKGLYYNLHSLQNG